MQIDSFESLKVTTTEVKGATKYVLYRSSDKKKYTNLNIPVIQNRVSNNFDLPDEIDDEIDPSIETEFNFYDPYQRNYDEIKDDVEIIDIDGGMGKPKQKVKNNH